MTDRPPVRLKAYPSPVPFLSPEKPRGLWEVTVTGELADRQSDLLNRLVDVPAGSRGIIWFDSCGGSVYAGLALATIVRTRSLQAIGIVVGECSSAALMPFAACRKRFVTPVSTLLFHPMRWQSEEDVRLEEATEWARHFRELEFRLDELLVKLFPVSEELLAQWTKSGRFVNGNELADAGLAQLIDPFEDNDCWKRVRST